MLEREIIIHVTFRRVMEMLLGCIVPSVAICALCISGFMPVESIQRELALNGAPIVFLIWNFILLRICYISFINRRIYYISNIIAYAVFTVIDVSAYIFLATDLYTWLFVITRLGRYSSLEINSLTAVIIFNCLLCASIFAAPIGLRYK